jgi:uncharacterized protein (TIGR02996 family)
MSSSTLELVRPFLDDVVENPLDYVPRLIYSDYLEENGFEERANFIRESIALSRDPLPVRKCRCSSFAAEDRPCENCREASSLYERLLDLLTVESVFDLSLPFLTRPVTPSYSSEGLRLAFVAYEGRSRIEAKISRGFVEEISLGEGDFLESALGFSKSLPLRKVTLSDRRPRSRSGYIRPVGSPPPPPFSFYSRSSFVDSRRYDFSGGEFISSSPVLDSKIFDLLDALPLDEIYDLPYGTTAEKGFPSLLIANEALGNALLAYLRERSFAT